MNFIDYSQNVRPMREWIVVKVSESETKVVFLLYIIPSKLFVPNSWTAFIVSYYSLHSNREHKSTALLFLCSLCNRSVRAVKERTGVCVPLDREQWSACAISTSIKCYVRCDWVRVMPIYVTDPFELWFVRTGTDLNVRTITLSDIKTKDLFCFHSENR